jgi:YesN/AraC family two-component response regulator
MPGMSGLELIEQVHREQPDLQCIIISGYDEFEFAQRALRIGVMDYLLKPLDGQQVESMLRRAIARLQAKHRERKERQDLRLRLIKIEKILAEEGGELGDPSLGAAEAGDHHIRRALRYINENLSRNLTLREVAEACFLAPSYFSEKFKTTMKVGFCRYLNALRMKKAARLMSIKDLKCREISEMLGFSSESYFSRVFKRATGRTPEEYRQLRLEP